MQTVNETPAAASSYCILALLDYEADSQEELLRALSRYVREQELVKDSFEEALIQREREYPTGLILERTNVAVPHTYPEHVLHPGMVVVRLKKPVAFVQMASDNEPVNVQYVFLLLIQDSEKQVFMLQSLMDLCQEEASVNALANAQTTQEVSAILTPFIKSVTEG